MKILFLSLLFWEVFSLQLFSPSLKVGWQAQPVMSVLTRLWLMVMKLQDIQAILLKEIWHFIPIYFPAKKRMALMLKP